MKKINKYISFVLACLLLFLGLIPLKLQATNTNADTNDNLNIPSNILSQISIDNSLNLEGWELSVAVKDNSNSENSFQENLTLFAEQQNEELSFSFNIYYKNENLQQVYQPGDLKIIIPRIPYKISVNNGNINSYVQEAIDADEITSTDKIHAWSYEAKNEYYIFTNNNIIGEDAASSYEGIIAMSYVVEGTDFINNCNLNFQATLNNNVFSNTALLNLTSSERPITNIKVTTEALNYRDIYPDGYYYVKYIFKITGGTGCRPIDVNAAYFSLTNQDNCVIYDTNLNELEVNDNKFKVVLENMYLPSNFYTCDASIIVAYPKSSFSQTDITEQINFYGGYSNWGNASSYNYTPTDIDLRFSTSTTLDLSQYELIKQDISANLTLSFSDWSSYSNIDYENITNKGYPTQWNEKFEVKGIEACEIIIGYDYLVAQNTNNEYVVLSEDEFYITEIQPINKYYFSDQDGSSYSSASLSYELYVKYRGETEYELLKESSFFDSIRISSLTDKKVNAYYIKYKGFTNGVKTNTSTYSDNTIIVSKSDILKGSKFYCSTYMQVLDNNGNLVYFPDESNYDSNCINFNLPEKDLEVYGQYMIRASCGRPVTDCKATLRGTDYTRYMTQDSVNEKFTITHTISPYFENLGSSKLLSKFSGFKLYYILAEGENLDGQISITGNNSRYNLISHDNGYFQSSEEYNSFIQEHSNIEIIPNVFNSQTNTYTGKTMVVITFDFTDNPLNFTEFYEYYNLYGSAINLATISFPIKVTYDNYMIYGSKFQSRCVFYPLDETEVSGYEDKDDYNINNNLTEKYGASWKITNNINSAISTQQDVQTSVLTNKTQGSFSSGFAFSTLDTNYQYKLRVRTGETNVTNLIIYNNLENTPQENSFKGEFLGIDTSFAESKGYTIKTYYSENINTNSLYINDSLSTEWKEYIEGTTNTNLVKSLAFEFLDADGNKAIVSKNTIIYVLINMKVPATETYGLTAYNKCKTEWNTIDATTSLPIENIEGLTSNTTKVILQNDKFDLTVSKIWNDFNNKYNYRPDSIDIILLKDNIETDRKQLSTNTNTVTFSDLPVDDAFRYSVKEVCNELFYESEVVNNENDLGYTIINTLKESAITTVSGKTTWENDNENYRPENITINLLKNGTKINSVNTNNEQNWEYVFEELPQYAPDGTIYNYTIEQEAINNYETTYSNAIEITFNNQCYSDYSSYIEIYYILEGETYKLGKWTCGNLAGKTIQIPTNNFYLYWHTGTYSYSYYGFSIDSITPCTITNPITSTKVTSSSQKPWMNYSAEEIVNTIYPNSAFGSYTHSNYAANINKVWHYTNTRANNVINTRIINTVTYSITYNIESEITLEDYILKGYSFDGWYNNSDLLGEIISEIKAGTFGNKDFYGNMTKNPKN